VERQQIRWVVFGLTGALGGVVTYLMLLLLFPIFTQPGLWHVLANLVGIPLFIALPSACLPLAVAIAIRRHRLWNIDFLSRSTLLSSLLTALLAGVYFASSIGLQTLFLSPLHPFTLSFSGQRLMVNAEFTVTAFARLSHFLSQ
jgi:hypothetical protein